MEKNRILHTKLEDSLVRVKKVITDFADSVQFSAGSESPEHVIAALVKTFLAPDRELSSTDVENFRMVWGKNFTVAETDKVISYLYNSTVITVAEAAIVLKPASFDYRNTLLLSLAELLDSSDVPDEAEKFLFSLAEALDIDGEDFKKNLEIAKRKSEKRKKLLKTLLTKSKIMV